MPTADIGPACQDVLVVGVRGSGQPPSSKAKGADDYDGGTGMGAEAFVAYQELVKKLPDGTRTATYGLPYPAVAVEKGIIEGTFFSKSLEVGVERLVEFLLSRTDTCDERETVVLAGYSQGAAVIHRVLQRGLIAPPMVNRISGVLLVADSDRDGSDVSMMRYGGAPQASIGIDAWLPNMVPPYPTAFSSAPMCGGVFQIRCAQVHSVCLPGDPICDFVNPSGKVEAVLKRVPGAIVANVKARIATHNMYRTRKPAAIPSMRAAATAIAKTTTERVVANRSSPAGPVGWPCPPEGEGTKSETRSVGYVAYFLTRSDPEQRIIGWGSSNPGVVWVGPEEYVTNFGEPAYWGFRMEARAPGSAAVYMRGRYSGPGGGLIQTCLVFNVLP